MAVPFVDLRAQYESIRPEIDAAIRQVIDECAFIGGPHVQAFEKAFAAALGVRHTIACGNGTDAIYIALRQLGIGPGDEVITSACSWIASSETISQAGATPVFADIEPRHFTIDPAAIEAKIGPRTKAIIPVHLYGHPADLTAILPLAERHGLAVIEDSAQAHFAQIEGRNVGTFGRAATFSFYPGKNLGAYGDAGAIVTNDDALATAMRRYARHGSLAKHDHEIEGINSRLDGLQAAILNVKLRHIADWTEQRIARAAAYSQRLAALEAAGRLVCPSTRARSRQVFHLYVIRAQRRDELKAYLGERGIETALHYPRALPFLPAYSRLGHTESDFPEAALAQREILSLPLFAEMTDAQIDEVVSAIEAFYARPRAH